MDGQVDGPLVFKTQKIGDNSKEFLSLSYRLCALNVDISMKNKITRLVRSGEKKEFTLVKSKMKNKKVMLVMNTV